MVFNGAARRPDGTLRYAVGEALLFPDNPALMQELSLRPLLEPETMPGAVAVAARERGVTTFQTPRIVFASGIVPYQDRLLLTFGIDDKQFGTTPIQIPPFLLTS